MLINEYSIKHFLQMRAKIIILHEKTDLFATKNTILKKNRRIMQKNHSKYVRS